VNHRNLFFGVTAVLGIVADQVTKAWVTSSIELYRGEIVVIPHIFSIVHARNPGAAFGLLRDQPNARLVFLVMTVLAVGVCADMFRRLPKDDRFVSFTLGLILSGALGNAIDRARFGYVVDFLRFYTDHPPLQSWLIERVGTYEYPSFNVADSALVVGVILFFLHYLLLGDRETADAAPTASST
jgi:signal peptidase II